MYMPVLRAVAGKPRWYRSLALTCPHAVVALLIWAAFGSQSIYAASILQVKGQRALMNIDQLAVNPGDIMVIVDSQGKSVGKVRIDKVKSQQAIGTLSKNSKAESGQQIKPLEVSRVEPEPEYISNSNPNAVAMLGVQIGYTINNMDVRVLDQDVALSGNGFSLKAQVDAEVLERFWFRGAGGYESFQATSNVDCNGVVCETNIGYLAFDFWGRYLFAEGRFRPWLGAGFALMFPIQKDSTAIKTTSITNTSLLAGGIGVDIFLNPTLFLPVAFEYGVFPSSNDVSATTAAIRLGLGWAF